MDPPPAKGSTTSGGSSGYAARTRARLVSRYLALAARSQLAKSPMNLSSAFRRSSSVGPGAPCTEGRSSRALCLKSGGQHGSHGSGQSSASSIARQAASGRRAHHRCSVEGCPCRIDFSRAACLDTSAMGKSTSASRLHSLGIIERLPQTPRFRFRRSPNQQRLRRGPANPASKVASGRSGEMDRV